MARTLWERIAQTGQEPDPLDPTTHDLPLEQFSAALYDVCSTVGEAGQPQTPPYDKTWAGKSVTRADLVAFFSISALQDNAVGGEIDLQYLLDVYDVTSTPEIAKVFMDAVFLNAQQLAFGYETEVVARARLDLIASN